MRVFQNCSNLHPVLRHRGHVEDVLALGVAARVRGREAAAARATPDAPVRDLVQAVLLVSLVLLAKERVLH